MLPDSFVTYVPDYSERRNDKVANCRANPFR